MLFSARPPVSAMSAKPKSILLPLGERRRRNYNSAFYNSWGGVPRCRASAGEGEGRGGARMSCERLGGGGKSTDNLAEPCLWVGAGHLRSPKLPSNLSNSSNPMFQQVQDSQWCRCCTSTATVLILPSSVQALLDTSATKLVGYWRCMGSGSVLVLR